MTKLSCKAKEQSKTVNKNSKKKSDTGLCECTIKYVFFIALVFGLTYNYFHRSVYISTAYFKNGIGDISIRHFASDLNTVMCQAYEVTSGEPADVFLVPGTAKVSQHKHNHLKRHGSQLFPNSDNRNNVFYLLEGSNIKVNACKPRRSSEDEVAILIFKGDDSWDLWRSAICTDCPTKRKILSNHVCEEGGSTHLSFHVEDRDTYYVTVTDKSEESATFVNVRAELEVEQATFDTRHALQRCYNSVDCTLNLKYSSDVDVVMKFGRDTTDSSFNSVCKYRVIFWLGVFVILPCCLIVLGFCCCGCIFCCEKKDKKKSGKIESNKLKYGTTNDKDKLLDNELPPGYSSVVHTGSIQVV